MKKLEDGFKIEEDKHTTITSFGKFKDLDTSNENIWSYYAMAKDFANPDDELIYVDTYYGPLMGMGNLYLKDKDGNFTYGATLWIS